MKTEYTRELRENYLKIVSDTIEDYGIKMLKGQEIPGLLKVMERKINGESHYMYKISSLISMEDIYGSRGMSGSEIESFNRCLLKLLDIMDNYLMDYNSIIFKPEYIFWDSNKNEWYFVYFPEGDNTFSEELKVLYEYIIKIVNHKDNKAVTMAYGIYKRLCEENINPRSLFEFETTEKEEGEVIKEKRVIEEVIPEPVIEEVEEPDYIKIYIAYGVVFIYGILVMYSFIGLFFKGVRIKSVGAGAYVIFLIILGIIGYMAYGWYKKNKSLFVKQIKRQVEIPFEREKIRVLVPRENDLEENATVFLGEEQELLSHCIKWQENGNEKSFLIEEKAILIGSAWDKVDCVINGRGISRIHARITTEGKSYYIKDMNSTNGTKVNGRELACYELCEIKPRDKIELGNLECVFV